MDGGDFAVHESPVAFDGAAPGVADALVAEADAEGGDFRPEVFEHVVGDAGLFGAARAGRDDDVGGLEGFDFVDGGFVVAKDHHGARRVELADALDEVVGKRVVVVDEDDEFADEFAVHAVDEIFDGKVEVFGLGHEFGGVVVAQPLRITMFGVDRRIDERAAALAHFFAVDGEETVKMASSPAVARPA